MEDIICISIIIPVYNVEPFLDDCLNSVSVQNTAKIEVIAINDGSTDNSLDILKKHQEKDNQIRIIDLEDNHGLAYARNLGIKKASGKYLLFLDSDDWLEYNTCESLQKKAMEMDFDIISFGFNMHEDYHSPLNKGKVTKVLPENNIDQSDCFRHALTATEGFLPYVWKYLFRKEFIIKNKLYFPEGIYFEDVPFTVRAFYYCRKLGIIRHPLCNYRIRRFSITDSKSKKKIDDSLTAHFMIKTFLESENVYNQYKNEFIIRLLSCCISPCFNDYLSLPKKEKDKDLIKFMVTIRKGPLLSSGNLKLLRSFGEKQEFEYLKSTENFYLKAYYFLITIRYMYGLTKISFRIKRFLLSK